MRIVRIAVVASFLLTVLILCWALLSTSSMRYQFRSEPAGTVMALAVGVLVCGWPWFKAFSVACREDLSIAALVFAGSSVAITGAFASLIASAPAEGIGWYTIICILLIWAAYVVIFWIAGKVK